MKFDKNDSALVVIEPWNDVLSENGVLMAGIGSGEGRASGDGRMTGAGG
jgi:hypothetical protein